MRQQAVVLTHWKGIGTNTNPYRPALVDLLQAGETLINVDTRLNGDISGLADDACIVLVEAEDTRLSALDGTAHKVLTRRNIRLSESVTPSVTALEPSANMTALEVTALATWLTAKFGVTNTQIATWFDSTPAQLANWLQNHTREEAVQKLITAWRRKIWK